MKITAILVLLCSLALGASAQRPTQRTTPAAHPAPTQTPSAALESERWEAATALESPAERVEALTRFLEDFPKSRRIASARESLSAARAAYGDALIEVGDTERGIDLFELAVREAPTPFPQRLFDEVISRIPMNLVLRGKGEEGLEIADLIEEKARESAPQLLVLASFHLGLENGSDAIRIAERALELDPASSDALITLALANRMNFDLGASAAAYRKVLELDPDSAVAGRGLADALRGLGRTDEAISIYRGLLAKNESDFHSETGLILALFDIGDLEEAEEALYESLGQNPGNVLLLAAAAYRYAAAGNGDKAVDLAASAIRSDPRFIWSHIALARGLMLQGRPVEAERALLAARRYGNFPSLDYEIASARLRAGFFREAAEELQRNFTIENGEIVTRLGGRIESRSDDFRKLLEGERLASIFVPEVAENPDEARRLKALLEFSTELAKDDADELKAVESAERFAGGNDPMRIHRQLFAASALAEKRIAADKVIELTRAATGNTDAGLDAANPSAAVMASELYETRRAAFAVDQYLVVPEVPKNTLQSILRGRIEELTGWAFFQKGDLAAASTRLRRAISVLPKDSAWWRSSKWRLGEVFETEGNDKEALDHYISGYDVSRPEIFKYLVIERLYKKVHGSDEGLEEKIGPNPIAPLVAAVVPEPAVAAIETATEKVEGNSPETEKEEEQPEVEVVPEEVGDPVKKVPEPEEVEDAIPEVEEKAEELPNKEDSEPDPEETLEPEESKEEPKTDPKPEEPAKTEDNDPDDPTQEERVNPKEEGQKTGETGDPEKEEVEEEKGPEKPAEKEDKGSKPETEEKERNDNPEEPEKPAPLPLEEKTEERPEPKSAEQERSLFDPIIITVPSGRTSRVAEPRAAPETKTDERPDEPARDEPRSTEQDHSGTGRPRVVAGRPVSEATEPCTISLSQENVTLVARGGSIGLLVGVDNGRIEDIRAISSSPRDVEVISDSDGSVVSTRAFFVLTSISPKVGIFNVTFEAPCGRKQLAVRVR
jgi:tetratricopeptide (TPR) repeat protein